MIPVGGVKFSWPVAREKLTEGSLSHGSQFLTEHRRRLVSPLKLNDKEIHLFTMP